MKSEESSKYAYNFHFENIGVTENIKFQLKDIVSSLSFAFTQYYKGTISEVHFGKGQKLFKILIKVTNVSVGITEWPIYI